MNPLQQHLASGKCWTNAGRCYHHHHAPIHHWGSLSCHPHGWGSLSLLRQLLPSPWRVSSRYNTCICFSSYYLLNSHMFVLLTWTRNHICCSGLPSLFWVYVMSYQWSCKLIKRQGSFLFSTVPTTVFNSREELKNHCWFQYLFPFSNCQLKFHLNKEWSIVLIPWFFSKKKLESRI